jgi:RNA polymerase primary sigma factor
MPKKKQQEPVVDLNAKKQELFDKAKKDGVIDQQDIWAAIPDTPGNAEVLDQLYTQLADASLEVTTTEAAPVELSDEWVAEAEEEEVVPEARVYLEDDVADDSVRLYLREIGKIPLLSAEEELTLANQVVVNQPKLSEILAKISAFEEAHEDDDGYLKELTSAHQAEYQKLKSEAAQLSRPKDKMAEANMRLVVSIAKRYVGRGLDLLDLIQEGNTGLLRAVEKFDPDKGFKFSTYATWWIRQAITRAIADQARTIRIPVHMVETINKLLRTQRRLTQEMNREPTNEEIAKEMEIEVDKVEHIMKIKQDISSLDASIRDDEEDSVLADFIEDEDTISPEESATNQLLKEQVKNVLGALTEREQKIIKLRFGLEDGKQHTLEEVGQEFSVTRERIRQIEAKALAKLRKHKDAKKLHDYIK